jgi:hypothetical protein
LVGGEVWEAVKGTGSVVGLLTGCFVVWDRLVRQRPTFYLIAGEAGMTGSRQILLRVTNNDRRSIIVRFPKPEKPTRLTVLISDDINASVVAATRSRFPARAVAPSASADLTIAAEWREKPSTKALTIRAQWCFAQTLGRAIWRPTWVRTDKRALETLADGVHYGFGEWPRA